MIAPHGTDGLGSVAAACAQVLVRQWWHQGRPIADWLGWQEDGVGGHIPLWNLVGPLGEHPAGSTVSTATIERLLGVEATT
jgi:hypothetical protein